MVQVSVLRLKLPTYYHQRQLLLEGEEGDKNKRLKGTHAVIPQIRNAEKYILKFNKIKLRYLWENCGFPAGDFGKKYGMTHPVFLATVTIPSCCCYSGQSHNSTKRFRDSLLPFSRKKGRIKVCVSV